MLFFKSTHCLICKEAFSRKNCFTRLGWRETQLSGFCEKCFDESCKDKKDEEWKNERIKPSNNN